MKDDVTGSEVTSSVSPDDSNIIAFSGERPRKARRDGGNPTTEEVKHLIQRMYIKDVTNSLYQIDTLVLCAREKVKGRRSDSLARTKALLDVIVNLSKEAIETYEQTSELHKSLLDACAPRE
ncbi:hypothetical protein GGR16_003384 [Chelatococcus caeni]|uniref:Uncharacterized protein n=1 Tax=Chelatococcus caeni TaxID=1348468 RepID=A0A840C7N4_9HYPH|nr:hypothetical protein [Chelatococcus caeni]MBB4018337.1 hypothetical protein [Chelatococcus caeni]